MATLTIDQFRADARLSPDLSRDTEASVRDQYTPEDYPDGTPAGLVYPCGLVIEDWERMPICGGGGETYRYFLLIGNCQWLSNDLAELEPRLYEFYVAEHGG